MVDETKRASAHTTKAAGTTKGVQRNKALVEPEGVQYIYFCPKIVLNRSSRSRVEATTILQLSPSKLQGIKEAHVPPTKRRTHRRPAMATEYFRAGNF